MQISARIAQGRLVKLQPGRAACAGGSTTVPAQSCCALRDIGEQAIDRRGVYSDHRGRLKRAHTRAVALAIEQVVLADQAARLDLSAQRTIAPVPPESW